MEQIILKKEELSQEVDNKLKKEIRQLKKDARDFNIKVNKALMQGTKKTSE